MGAMDERAYRQAVEQTFRRIERAFDDVDPDLVEASRTGDVLTLAFADGARCVISPQPPLRQIWVAARASAWHFAADAAGGWREPGGQTLGAWLAALVREAAGVAIEL